MWRIKAWSQGGALEVRSAGKWWMEYVWSVKHVSAQWLCTYFVICVGVVVPLSQDWIWFKSMSLGFMDSWHFCFQVMGIFIMYNYCEWVELGELQDCVKFTLFYFENRSTALWTFELPSLWPSYGSYESSTLGKKVMWEFKSRKRWWWGGWDGWYCWKLENMMGTHWEHNAKILRTW